MYVVAYTFWQYYSSFVFFQEEIKTEVQTDNVRCVLVYQTLNYWCNLMNISFSVMFFVIII